MIKADSLDLAHTHTQCLSVIYAPLFAAKQLEENDEIKDTGAPLTIWSSVMKT